MKLPYLDKNHPNFSTQLYIAVSAWTDLFGDENKELPNSVDVREMLEGWLKKKGIEVEEETIVDISIIIEPDQMSQ